MRILVTFAVDAEFAPWRKLCGFSAAEYGDARTYTGRIGACETIVLLTGISTRAWGQATKIIWDGKIDACISAGLAGGLRDQHRPGEILVPAEVHATGRNKVIPCDSSLLKIALQCGAKAVSSFVTVDRVVVTSEEKRELGAKADAVEMESGDILLEAFAFGAKVIAIRSISDAVEEDLPLDFNRVMTETGDVSFSRALLQAVAHPTALPALIRFGQQSRRAADNLAHFLEGYVPKLAQLGTITRSEEVSAI